MSNVTILLNELLRKHNAHCNSHPRKRSDTHDEFLKEAYRIVNTKLTLPLDLDPRPNTCLQNDHIASLQTYLLLIRPAYLSTSLPHRRGHPPASKQRLPNGLPQEPTYLDNPARDAIDTSSKQVLRDLNASVRQLAEAENIRRTSQAKVLENKYSKGVLGRWAAGASGGDKSPEQAVEEGRRSLFDMHRDSVMWYLGRKLEEVGEVQRAMMERRLERELEKGRSVLYKVRGSAVATENGTAGGMNGHAAEGGSRRGYKGGKGLPMEDESRRQIEQQLSPEQLQLFARENQDMLKQYEDTLDQVRYVYLLPPLISTPAKAFIPTQDGRTVYARDFRASDDLGSESRRAKRQYLPACDGLVVDD
jgi:syntaxin 18